MNISWSISITNARMHARELTVDEFMAAFAPENVRTQPTKNGPNYIAGRLLDYNKPRGKGNIIDRCAAVLDCDDVERGQLVEVINDLVDEVMCSPGGAEEVGRLAHETGAVSPATATLRQMRALKMRLETSLIYYYSHNMFPGAYTRMRE